MGLSALCANPVGYILDAVILLGLIIYVIICAKRGFVKMVFHFMSGIVALIAAISLAKVAVTATGGLFGLLDILTEKFEGMFANSEGFNIPLSEGDDLKSLLQTKDLVAIIATLVVKKYSGDFAGKTLAFLAGSTIAELLCTLIAGVALFFLLKIVCKLLSKILTAIFKKIKLLGTINSLLGFILGLLEGIFIISVLISVMTLIPSEALTNFFNSSLILRLLYNHNPIVWLLGLFL
jgi:uncharacterized membrane protein required for colicin V production